MYRHSNAFTLACLLLFLPGISQAQRLMLTWEFDRSYLPAPDNFILAQTQTGMPEQQAKVALSEEGVCSGVVENIHDTFCTIQSQCPAAGTIVAYLVYAQWGTRFSEPSNIATCYTKPGEPCVCHDPLDVAPSPQTSAGTTPSAPVVQPPVLATTPPSQVQTASAPLSLAAASPTVPLFQIPAVPSSAGT